MAQPADPTVAHITVPEGSNAGEKFQAMVGGVLVEMDVPGALTGQQLSSCGVFGI